MVYWILQLSLKRQKFYFFSGISFPALAYILLAGISILQAEDKLLSFCVLYLIIKGYLVFLYFANNIKNKNELMLIISALALVIFLQGVVGSLQYFGGSTLGFGIIGETKRMVLGSIRDVIAELEKDDSELKASVEYLQGQEICYTGAKIEAEGYFPAWLIPRDSILVQHALSALISIG